MGDTIYREGVVNAILSAGFATNVHAVSFEDKVDDHLLADAELVVVCADDEMNKGIAAVRRIARRNRTVRIAFITGADWEERLDYINERKVGACVNLSIAGDQLIAVLSLMMDGFSII